MDTLAHIKTLCKEKGISLHTLEKTLGYGQGSLAKSSGIKAERVKEIADYFGVTMEKVMTGENGKTFEEEYYTNKKTGRMVQEYFEKPEIKMLFDATKDMQPEDVEKVVAMIKVFKGED